jgi:hypothetical protein
MQMLINLQFISLDEDDLESGLQPFMISNHGQKTLAQLQQMNNMYDMIQPGTQFIHTQGGRHGVTKGQSQIV